MIDAMETWRGLRKHIPEPKRYKAFAGFVDQLLDAGWDQDGYIYCDWPKSWKEVHKWEKENRSDDDEGFED